MRAHHGLVGWLHRPFHRGMAHVRLAWMAFCLGLGLGQEGTPGLGEIGLCPSAAAAEVNLWPNATLELDANRDGLPDFWHRGGSDPGLATWDTNAFVSATHALSVWDTSVTDYGEWYSDPLAISAFDQYQLRFQRRYRTTGIMRLSALFYDAQNAYLAGGHFTVYGTNLSWRMVSSDLIVPPTARSLRLTLASGGGLDAQGTIWVDDLQLFRSPKPELEPGQIRRVAAMPDRPTPLAMRDWRQVAWDYDELVFNLQAEGPFLPLIRLTTQHPNFDLDGFWLASYVGTTTHGGESINSLAAVLGATLAGIDKSDQNGRNWVLMQLQYFNHANGEDLVLNHTQTTSGASFWYELYPHILFYALVDKYPDVAKVTVPYAQRPGRASMEDVMRITADRWREAAWIMGGQTNRADFGWTAFRFATGQPVFNGQWREPDAAAAIAWLEYMAYARFRDPRHLEAARWGMDYLDRVDFNPYYENLLPFGAYLAARMNAELGTTYNLSRLLNWCFEGDSKWRYGWGVASEQWGDHEAHGLAASRPDGYAFAMNTFSLVGALTPLARYDPRYAPAIGKWVLHAANNTRLFYPDALPPTQQSSAFWSGDPKHVIPYEGLRREWGGYQPFATGDPLFYQWGPQTDLALYGGSHVGLLAGIVQPTSDPLILKLDLLATDYFRAPAQPSWLLYNPDDNARDLPWDVGAQPQHLYDAVQGTFLVTNATGTVTLPLPPKAARVLVTIDRDAALGQEDGRLFAQGVVIDWRQGALDRDLDGLPDWWESRYYGSASGANPSAATASGLTNLAAYQLGLNPLDQEAGFRVAATWDPERAQVQITWNATGGKAYTVECADNLADSDLPFRPAASIQAGGVAPGLPTALAFTDDFSQTGTPPATGARFYRVRLSNP